MLHTAQQWCLQSRAHSWLRKHAALTAPLPSPVCPHLAPLTFRSLAAAAFEPLANAIDQVEREMYPTRFQFQFQPPTSNFAYRKSKLPNCLSRFSAEPLPPLRSPLPWPSRNKGRCLFVLQSVRNQQIRRTVDLFPRPRLRLICKLTVTRGKKKIYKFSSWNFSLPRIYRLTNPAPSPDWNILCHRDNAIRLSIQIMLAVQTSHTIYFETPVASVCKWNMEW